MTMKNAFHHLAEVLLDMEPISDLDCIRCSQACPQCISTRSITTDELNTRMCFEPAFQARASVKKTKKALTEGKRGGLLKRKVNRRSSHATDTVATTH